MHSNENIWLYAAIILAIVVIAKIVSKKTSTVDVIWLILFGAIATNLHILPEHEPILEHIGEWGIVFIMFALGFEEDIEHFTNGVKRGMGIAVIGAIFPFIARYYSAIIFGYSDNAAMLWGLTMTATAVSLTMMSLRSENLHKSNAATGIMTAAVIDDILSLIGVAIIVPVILANGDTDNGVDFIDILIIILKVIAFFIIVSALGLLAFPERLPEKLQKNASDMQKLDFLISKIYSIVGIRKLLIAYQGEFTPLMMVFIAMSIGAIAYMFGFHPAIGAYMAGLFLKKDYFLFDKDTEEAEANDKHYQESKLVIDHLAFTIFGPIFFVNLGSKIIFDLNIFLDVLPATITLFVIVFLLQVLSASFAAKFTGGYEWHDSIMIGFGMLGRAELAFIVLNIAFVQSHIIDIEQFYTLVFTVFLLNISVPMTSQMWKPYYKGEKELKLFGQILSNPNKS